MKSRTFSSSLIAVAIFCMSSAVVTGARPSYAQEIDWKAAAGVGTLTLCDGDTVDLTNLQRQILHTTERIGRPKAESGRATLAAINPQVEVVALSERVEG